MVTARVTNRRLAGTDHAVITVEGGGSIYRREPCPTCPWRLDAVGEFPAEAFLHSANTGADGQFFSADAMHTFGCHQSGADKPATCAGYILGGEDAIGWRLAASFGKFDPARVRSKVPLFGSYFEMATANGVPVDHPAMIACKPWRMK